MANYQFASDLVTDILFRAGEPTDGTSDFDAVALRYLNRAYWGVIEGGGELDPTINEDWYWIRKYPPGTLTLNPVITTGTVSVTNGSATVTFSSPPAATTGWFLALDGESDIYRLTNATTLDSKFTGATAAAATYQLRQLEYTLASDALDVISPMRVYRADHEYEVWGMDVTELDKGWPLRLTESGVPDAYAVVFQDSTGVQTVRFNRYGGTSSTDLIRVEYDYIIMPTALTNTAVEPLIPWRYRKNLSDWALFLLFSDKNDSRADGVGAMARAGLRAMSHDNRQTLLESGRERFGQIRPRLSQISKFRSPLRTQTGLIVG